MQKNTWRRRAGVLLLIVVLAVGGTPAVHAATTSVSPNYQMTEAQFGGGSTLESCSGNYCARASIGDVAAGSSQGASTAATFGAVTPDEPLLEVIVEQGESHLGYLSTEETATKTMTVKVRSYLSNGYMLQMVGAPPKYGNHTLATPDTPTASRPGTEQFAINVAANTTPNVGASPVQVPSGDMSFGAATDKYKTPNRFMYASGDVVAESTRESGRTDYTVSMIINISSNTPAGHFSGDFSAVVIPVF